MAFLRCSVVDADTGAQHDVEITFDPATTVQSLLAALPLDVAGRPVFAGPETVDPDGTIGDSALLVGGVLSVGAPTADLRQIPQDSVGVLRVVAGPDAGAWTWVSAGSGAVVGRGDRVDLGLTDPKTSRPHAEVAPGAPSDSDAVVRDLGSANGTTVGGIPAAGPTRVPSGGCFEVGGSQIQWIPLDRVHHLWHRAADGRLEFTRRFHSAPTPLPATVALPATPTDSGRGMMMLAASLGLPLVLGVAMFAATGSALFLLTALAMPFTGGLQYFLERRRRKAEEARFTAEQDRARAEITAAVTAQELIRRRNDPDELSLTLSALGALPRLWTKRLDGPDALTVRVGTRDEPAAVQLQGERWPGLEPPRVRAVPVTVDLRATGVLGIVGDRPMVAGLARWVLVQLATRRSPEDLWLVVLSSTNADHLRWARWLPHLDTGADGDSPARMAITPRSLAARVSELNALVRARLAAAEEQSGEVRFGQDLVVVLAGAHELRKLTGMRTILTRGPEVGVYAICLDSTDINECRGRVTVDAEGRLDVVRSLTADTQRAQAETTTDADAERISRLLAPLRDQAHASATEGAIPYPVRYLDLVAIHDPAPGDVLRVWDEHPGPTTRVPLGADAQGTVEVDLAEQGPHTMLGGATGAGKSILLQTLVVSLLLHNRSDELNLVLVDFKGGAAFAPFENCPQVVGLIRSTGATPADTFDDAAADRVLASIRAEVDRRERLLAAYGGEIGEYLKNRSTGQPPLPRLLMIFDEFARVLDASPGFVQELVKVSGKGRSLGMHLLLATQSLSGKLTAEMKNNIELRISLRQNQAEESTEVLDVPDAVNIPGRLKGRGLILCTKEKPPLPRPFQAGYLGAPPPTGQAPTARVRIIDWPAVGESRPKDDVIESDRASDQDLLIAAIEQAASRVALPVPFRPLLPPLPGSLSLADLQAASTVPCPPDAIGFGLVDIPSQQAQPTAALSLSGDDRLMIAGGPQSGRSTAIRTLIHSAVTRFTPDQLHLYAVEREPAGLVAYHELPHCGGIFGPAEPDRLRRFVSWLGAETERRLGAQFAGGPAPPTLLVLIDGWELFHDPSDSSSIETSLVRILRQVIKSGPKVGVRVVVACDRGPFTSKPGDLFNDRLVLMFPQVDLVRSALPTGSRVPTQIPGRAGDAATGLHLQIAQPTESAAKLVSRFADTTSTPGRAPRRFGSLPVRLTLEDVDRRQKPEDAGPLWIPLGIGGPELAPVGVDLFAGPQSLLVSGPPGSGRSTAAAGVVQELSALGVGCVVLCGPRSPLVHLLTGRSGVAVLVGPTMSDEVVREAATALGTERLAVIADDCEQLTVVPTTANFDEVHTLLAEATTPDRLGRMALVLCGNGMALLDGPRRSLTTVTRHVLEEGNRILLVPSAPATAREHRITLEADQYLFGPAGRGYLARGREQLLVQLAATPLTPATPATPVVSQD